MVPKLSQNANVRIEQYKSRTYRLDFENKRIVGIVDGLEAAAQACKKIFQSERYSERIYSGDYGIELERLLGASMPFVEANIEPTIADAISADDRFLDLRLISLRTGDLDSLTVSCRINTTLGEISVNFEF